MSNLLTFSDTKLPITRTLGDYKIDTSSGTWVLGLIGFEAYNTVPNIDKTNNLFYYYKSGNPHLQKLKIPEGAYDIEDIERVIQERLPKEVTFTLTDNPNTQQCTIHSNVTIDFSHPNSLQKLLGFRDKQLKADKTHTSEYPIQINRVNSIRVHCSVTTGSFENGRPSHIIYEFFPNVPPGYKITIEPQHPIYLPINVREIDTVTVSVTDQNNHLLNFRGDIVNIRLHLKRWE
jgi:hypothetical protein